jgi:glyoxylase I family protein
MLKLLAVHHIAIITGDYERSKKFYTEVMGFDIAAEHFRADRQSYKLDLTLNGIYTIELFSFPDPPKRLSQPEAVGLRHLAFEVNDLEEAIAFLREKNIPTEDIRIDEHTGKRFSFFRDPDDLPLELYERQIKVAL